jgi:L-malate glycosyltransferase
MNILHVFNGEDTGGAKVHLFSLLQQLKDKNITLGLIGNADVLDEAKKLGVDVVHFKQQSRYNLSVLSQIANFVKTNNVDIVHTHGARANLYGYFLKKRSSFTWFTTVHSDPSDDFLGRGIKGKVFTKLHMFVLKKVDHLFAISERFKEMLLNYGINQNKITVIYNGIDFHKTGKRQLSREDLGLQNSEFVVTMVARLDPVKAHTNVLKALALTVKKQENIKLLLVGEGSLRQQLTEEVKSLKLTNHVHFLGHRSDVDDILYVSDVKLLASYSESFPLVILEAARAHTAVISTDVGGVTDLISEPSLGWVIPNNNPDIIATALLEAYEAKSHGKLKPLEESLLQKASQNYDIQQFSSSVYETYEKVNN